MRRISKLLKRGNLTPRERILLLVADKVREERYGKPLLSDADRMALCDWTPKNLAEQQQFDVYWRGWEFAVLAAADANNVALTVKTKCFAAMLRLAFLFWRRRDLESADKLLKKWFSQISEAEAFEVILENSGFELEDLIYTFAFEGLSEDLRKDLVALYEWVETDRSYLTQEELIADWLMGRLPTDVLINAILEALRWQGEWCFGKCFANLQGYDLLRKWATQNRQFAEAIAEPELVKQITEYSAKRGVKIEDLLRDTLSQWLANGLFVDDYQSVALSEAKGVFAEWLDAKAKAKEMIQALIDKGELEVENRIYELLPVSESEATKKASNLYRCNLVTGSSLYRSNADLRFVREYKLQADYLKGLGYMMLYLQDHNFFLSDYALLLGFLDIFKRLSKIYEIDLTYRVKEWIDSCREVVEALNYEIANIEEKRKEEICQKYQIRYRITIIPSTVYINLDKVKPERTDPYYSKSLERLERYYQEFRKLFEEF